MAIDALTNRGISRNIQPEDFIIEMASVPLLFKIIFVVEFRPINRETEWMMGGHVFTLAMHSMHVSRHLYLLRSTRRGSTHGGSLKRIIFSLASGSHPASKIMVVPSIDRSVDVRPELSKQFFWMKCISCSKNPRKQNILLLHASFFSARKIHRVSTASTHKRQRGLDSAQSNWIQKFLGHDSTYAGLCQFHHAKGFDPDSEDAWHLGGTNFFSNYPTKLMSGSHTILMRRFFLAYTDYESEETCGSVDEDDDGHDYEEQSLSTEDRVENGERAPAKRPFDETAVGTHEYIQFSLFPSLR
ncbi:hypothetical protein B0H14DRAFT_2573583 [Mycena olivaceomarginata]|nr:hypothetical protein B0H14DRAFT_2573583 [Mycena olivaceomarginata]